MNILKNPNVSRKGALAIQNMPLDIANKFIRALENAKTVSDLSPQYQDWLKNGYSNPVSDKVSKSIERTLHQALQEIHIEWED